MAKGFNKFMIVEEIAANSKIARLTDAEFRCLVQGVWSLAAKSTPRGYLMVGPLPANDQDIAHQARCNIAVAKRTMAKLRELGMVVLEDGIERCHDWDEINPAPRSDGNNARRQALHRDTGLRERIRLRDGSRCRYCAVEVRWHDRRSPIGGTYDHVDPDGPNADWNLVVACRACNARKSDKSLPEAGMNLLPEPNQTTPNLDTKLDISTPDLLLEEEVEAEEKKQLDAPALDRARLVHQVFDEWISATERDKTRTKLTPDRRRCIEKALASHGLEDCLAAVQHIGADAWAGGANERGRPFNDIHHALGSGTRLERWRDQQPRTAVVSERDVRRNRNADALKSLMGGGAA